MFGTRRSSRLFCIKEPAYSRHRPGTRPVRRAPRAVEQRLAHPGPRKTNNIAWGTSHGRRRLPSFAGRVVPGDRAADERSRGSSRAAPQSRPISRPSHENGGLDRTRCTDGIGERGWAATISGPSTTAAWSWATKVKSFRRCTRQRLTRRRLQQNSGPLRGGGHAGDRTFLPTSREST
jgi:hypothetical protein